MLTRFRVKNYLSFSEMDNGYPVEFTMWPGSGDGCNKQENLKILNFAAVYGANASGKSNLVKAMLFMREAVLGHFSFFPVNRFCKTDEMNRNKPSYFEVEIEFDGSYYAYGFEIVLSERRFTSEWLVNLLPDGQEVYIFDRNVEKGCVTWNKSILYSSLWDRLKIYSDDVCDNNSVLLLTFMNENKERLYSGKSELLALRKCFEWIKYSWNISRPEEPITNYSYVLSSGKWEKLKNLIRYFDFDIVDIQRRDANRNKIYSDLPLGFQNKITHDIGGIIKNGVIGRSDIREGIIGVIAIRSNNGFYLISVGVDGSVKYEEVLFKHSSNESLYVGPEESDGTMRMLDILEIFMNDSEKTYVIDELDRCLHPELSYKFVKTYFEQCGEKKIQLIVTTHETGLLDLTLLRRDEVWFVEKNRFGNSELYSLDRYKERFDKHLVEAYLEGRFGGVPIFDKLYPGDGG